MTFKQKLAKTLISEIEICHEIAQDYSKKLLFEEAKYWRSKVNQCSHLAEIMFGIDSCMENSQIIKEMKKFAPKEG